MHLKKEEDDDDDDDDDDEQPDENAVFCNSGFRVLVFSVEH